MNRRKYTVAIDVRRRCRALLGQQQITLHKNSFCIQKKDGTDADKQWLLVRDMSQETLIRVVLLGDAVKQAMAGATLVSDAFGFKFVFVVHLGLDLGLCCIRV